MHWFERIANRQIDAAEARGELRGLAGEGKPLDPERLRETADDVLHRLMADGGYLPPEIEIAKEVAAMRAAFAQIEDEDERRALQRRIAMAELKQNIAADARRRFMR
ncbi:MAG: DUF1992 domain-containing protein [Paracoccus sp. (in: a-proteobacteria)]|uniref:DnaJ family domain-containing protein n=1 Tax=Paracoccus sp. TaxID=267 RepID=UPI0026E04D1D|nr:DUF1992 domain-containing protein [Paracoccus sp. (in: a-proteobacteria)]MDO5621803.1 DUF1992 domain-containing protein [Paracoccus sp. (in: a-proteobacteria)]